MLYKTGATIPRAPLGSARNPIGRRLALHGAMKKALAAIRKHGNVEAALTEVGVEIEGLDEVREIFLHPRVDPQVRPTWREPDLLGAKAMLCDEFDFSPARVEPALVKFAEGRKAAGQASLDAFSAGS